MTKTIALWRMKFGLCNIMPMVCTSTLIFREAFFSDGVSRCLLDEY